MLEDCVAIANITLTFGNFGPIMTYQKKLAELSGTA
jgi:hypothetical protein